ncbi:malectin domain-containing carbohydrate-binding protein [Streptomyces sp. NPDC096311]|uniref:malectin domain-containing carbohydrate-binding protein n=1 Tax=Streptomyces sp. NPDC096311 TaxID=3366083 RepID=UPI003823E1A3
MSSEPNRRAVLRLATGVAVAATTGGWSLIAGAAPALAQDVPARAKGPLDVLTFGNDASETAHRLTGSASEKVTGGLGQSARLFTPLDTPGVWGGSAEFTLACDPKKPTYVTIKLWGSDAGWARGMLMLFAEGKQVGYYQLGDVEPLDICQDEARTIGRFFYHTVPLPPAMTRGRKQISLGIRSMGGIYVYGGKDNYYFDLEKNTRGVYRLYSHTDPFFTLPADDVQGTRFDPPLKRLAPGPEVLDLAVQKNKDFIASLLAAKPADIDLFGLLALAEAYRLKDTPAYGNSAALDQIVAGLDALRIAFLADHGIVEENGPQQWYGFGKLGRILTLLHDELASRLAEPLSGTDGTRLDAYVAMLVESRDYWRQNLRKYTNQMMMCATGIYQCNRALLTVAPDRAIPEATVRDYCYQALGMKPWLGPENADGTPTRPEGETYYVFTHKGQGKELGYVGGYGEIVDGVNIMWEAVNGHDGIEDDVLKARMLKIIKARLPFRYPELDNQGNISMRLENVVGWRDQHFPGDVTYVSKASWDGHAFKAAALFQDPQLVKVCHEQLDDNQYWAQLKEAQLAVDSQRARLSNLRIPADYAAVMSLTPGSTGLPMRADQPDFVWSDEQDMVVALKNGTEILYAELYWRARWGINNMARIHHITPGFDHAATVWQHTEFEKTGDTYTQPDYVNWDYGVYDPVTDLPAGGFPPPGPTLHQAYAGTVYPVAKAPKGSSAVDPGTESPWAGRGTFYSCFFGRYRIDMNCRPDHTKKVEVPQGAGRTTKNLASGRFYKPGSQFTLEPRTTAVWDLEIDKDYGGTTNLPTPVSSFRINSGGGDAGDFVADTDVFGGTAGGGTTDTIDTSAVTDPAPQAVYQTERYGNFSYIAQGLSAGDTYTVRLHFAEIFWWGAGLRTFDVYVNGEKKLDAFDVFAAAGGKNKAVVKELDVTPGDSGSIVIQFSTLVDNAKVSGVELLKKS